MNETNSLSQTPLGYDALEIIRILLYFEVFKYPLTAKEIFERSQTSSLQHVEQELAELVFQESVKRFGDHYTINGNQDWVNSRINGNQMAKTAMPIAAKHAGWMQKIPFVRAVMLSGSISKDYMDENSDIDYFIIVEQGRLWIARLFFVFIQRFVLRSAKHFCFNYMISNADLSFKNKSFYPAIELMTLKPMYGATVYQELLSANPWAKEYFPNYPPSESEAVYEQHWFQKFAEFFFPAWLAEPMDNWFLQQTQARWEKRFPKHLFENGSRNLMIGKHVAKVHFTGHFDKIIQRWNNHLEGFGKKHQRVLRA
ncbi:MAG: hypothetical protein CFE25_05495 [Chitinophagaceae bacterium BSSC1]|nr:MAG: hypothetical protein CFE25_05495 [Chitinophagaceae bacterium BSSC1]